MKQITIKVPDNCELRQDGNTYTIVEKEKKVTYDDIAKELFANRTCFYSDTIGYITETTRLGLDGTGQPNNCTSKKQAEKLLAINKLMNVAKCLNGDWQPDWDDEEDLKWLIIIVPYGLVLDFRAKANVSSVYFKSKELAQQAIEILGEETIKLALCTDY